MTFETGGNPLLDDRGVTQEATAVQSGGNLEGKEVRFGAAASGSVRRIDDGHLDRCGDLRP